LPLLVFELQVADIVFADQWKRMGGKIVAAYKKWRKSRPMIFPAGFVNNSLHEEKR